uniref:SOCS box domain-containing protein n=1 Tax=Denticeps clupeoides TaxID=299321 RepID=A0AAY4D8Q7_9TELE
MFLFRSADAVAAVIRRGSVASLLDLIRTRRSLKEMSVMGRLPVHEAAAHGQEECLRVLLAVIDACDSQAKSPLLLAVEANHMSCAACLLEKGANPNTSNRDRETALHKACEVENADIVAVLLRFGSEVNKRCKQGWTPLHEAVCHSKVEICNMLVRAGARVNHHNIYGITPLFLAAQTGNEAALSFLLDHGASVNCQASDGATALYEACKNQHINIVKLLLSHRADANRPNKAGLLPLHVAAKHGFDEIVSMLIPVTSNFRIIHSGISPLHLAAENNEDETLKVLIAAGLNVNAQLSPSHSRLYQDCRTTPLYFAVINGNLETAAMLLQAGADANLDIFQPVLVAIRQGNIEMVRLLVEYGANVNVGMPTLPTTFPAMLIFCMRNPPMLKNLLDNGLCALSCFQCKYGDNQHPSVKVSCKDTTGLHKEECPLQVTLLLDYVGQVNLCAKLKELLDTHNGWVLIKERTSRCNPHHLGHLCRLAIREKVGQQRLKLLHLLPLPHRLIKYLNYAEGCHAFKI